MNAENLGSKTGEFHDEDEVFLRLHQLFDKYFPEDKVEIEIDGMEPSEALSYVYGMLLELNEDPDEILSEFGLIEDEENDS